MRSVFHVRTTKREQLIDITGQVEQIVRDSGLANGLVSVYAQGATAATMIQENWDESVQSDVIHLLQKMIPQGVWLHDAQDGNGDAHLKAGLVGPRKRFRSSTALWVCRAGKTSSSVNSTDQGDAARLSVPSLRTSNMRQITRLHSTSAAAICRETPAGSGDEPLQPGKILAAQLLQTSGSQRRILRHGQGGGRLFAPAQIFRQFNVVTLLAPVGKPDNPAAAEFRTTDKETVRLGGCPAEAGNFRRPEFRADRAEAGRLDLRQHALPQTGHKWHNRMRVDHLLLSCIPAVEWPAPCPCLQLF